MNGPTADLPDLGVVVGFLNTLDERSFSRHGVAHDGGEALDSPGALAAWLADHALAGPRTRLGERDLAAALALRAALRAALTPHEGPAGSGGPDIDAVLAGFPLRLTLAADGTLGLGPAADGPHPALARLAAAVALAVADGRWHRVRLCAAPDCRWAFHDTSRGGAGRWCSMAACGNRVKTRAYRERRHHTAPAG